MYTTRGRYGLFRHKEEVHGESVGTRLWHGSQNFEWSHQHTPEAFEGSIEEKACIHAIGCHIYISFTTSIRSHYLVCHLYRLFDN